MRRHIRAAECPGGAVRITSSFFLKCAAAKDSKTSVRSAPPLTGVQRGSEDTQDRAGRETQGEVTIPSESAQIGVGGDGRKRRRCGIRGGEARQV